MNPNMTVISPELASKNLNLLRSFVLVLITALLPACSLWNWVNFKEPKAELKEIQIRDANLQGATLIFVLSVQNPNKTELKISDVKYQAYLNQEFFAEAKVDQEQVVPAMKTASVELPMPIKYSKLAGGIARILSGEDLDYRIKGEAKISSFNVPFDKSGKFKIQK